MVFNVPVKSNLRWWPIAALLAVFLVNLPLGHAAWTDHRLDGAGLRATAEVVSTQAIPASGDDQRFFVTWRFDREADTGDDYTAQVSEPAFRAAEAEGRIDVEYLPGNPSANRAVNRADTGSMGLVITIGGNLAIVVMVALMLWVRRTTRFEVLATADVVRCKPPEMLTEVGDEVVIRGEIAEIERDRIVLTCNGRRIIVVLGDHTNPIGHQQYAEVRGRRLA